MRTHLLSRRLAGGLVALTAALGLAVALSGESPARTAEEGGAGRPAKPKVKPPPRRGRGAHQAQGEAAAGRR